MVANDSSGWAEGMSIRRLAGEWVLALVVTWSEQALVRWAGGLIAAWACDASFTKGWPVSGLIVCRSTLDSCPAPSWMTPADGCSRWSPLSTPASSLGSADSAPEHNRRPTGSLAHWHHPPLQATKGGQGRINKHSLPLHWTKELSLTHTPTIHNIDPLFKEIF